jgi:peroxiredoxin
MPKLENGQEIEFTLRDTDGEPWSVRDYRGKMIVIHACRGEF